MRGYELTEQRKPIVEGGNVFPDVGAIHISEIEGTLKNVAKALGKPEIAGQALGSVGKTEYSGDVDIAADIQPEEVKELFASAQKTLGADSVKMVSGILTLRFPIANYDESKQERQPRTGLVQVDIMPGDVDWMRTFYHSPGTTSQYKGAARNLALTAVAAQVDRKESKEQDEHGRPAILLRWMWSRKAGLQKVKRSSIQNEKTGKWLKKQNTEVLSEPTRDPEEIARILFKGKAGSEALNSLESIIEAVQKAYSPKEAAEVFQRITFNLQSRDQADNLPPELEPYA